MASVTPIRPNESLAHYGPRSCMEHLEHDDYVLYPAYPVPSPTSSSPKHKQCIQVETMSQGESISLYRSYSPRTLSSEVFSCEHHEEDHLLTCGDSPTRNHADLDPAEPLQGCVKSIPKEGQYMGEDLYLVRSLTPRLLVMSVFDGVGEWVRFRIDPTNYSQRLVDHLYDAYEAFKDGINRESMYKALLEGHDNAMEECRPWGAFGTTTASIAVVEGETLHTLNLGDSQIIVFRRYSEENFGLVFATEIQTHESSAPYQIGSTPTKTDCLSYGIDQRIIFVADSPADAAYETFDLKNDDVIIAATDGIWDNLDYEEISGIIEEVVSQDGDLVSTATLVETMASKILSLARLHSIHGAGALRPGKMDDITLTMTQYKL